MASENNKENQGNKTSQGGTSNRGFASMSEDKQRAIASLGGRAAHASGNAHTFSSEEARAAGRKGGQNSRGGSPQNSNASGTPAGSSEQHATTGSQTHKSR